MSWRDDGRCGGILIITCGFGGHNTRHLPTQIKPAISGPDGVQHCGPHSSGRRIDALGELDTPSIGGAEAVIKPGRSAI